MATYQYSAMNQDGKIVKGEMTAENDIDLEARLRDLHLDIVKCSLAKQKAASFLNKITYNDLIVLCLHLEQLSRAGVPLLEAISDVRDSTESVRLRDIMAGVFEEVKSGSLFSEALGRHPREFDEVFLGLIKAGEKTGDMTEVYTHLADHYKWTHDIKRKIKKARGYPMFLLVVMSAVIFVLMTTVVPKLIDFITSQGFEIPIHTRALIATSEFCQDYWFIIICIPIFSWIGFKIAYRVSDNFAYKADSLALKVPVFGNVIRKINMARFTHFFGVMFRSGVDILESLDSSRNVVANRLLKQSIADVKSAVSDGSTVTDALQKSGEFPTMVVRMFKVGENSGNMNDALENVNFFYNREVNDAVDNIVGMIQPALTLIMGVLIFWVISAVFGPLYDSFSQMPL
ncbi:MAG: type II secretion system F family protein [Rickettsiales bacterium]|nr:type II secretion system F family protein [Rickettsiales bacterium]